MREHTKSWSPVLSFKDNDSKTESTLVIVDWTGGEGAKPEVNLMIGVSVGVTKNYNEARKFPPISDQIDRINRLIQELLDRNVK